MGKFFRIKSTIWGLTLFLLWACQPVPEEELEEDAPPPIDSATANLSQAPTTPPPAAATPPAVTQTASPASTPIFRVDPASLQSAWFKMEDIHRRPMQNHTEPKITLMDWEGFMGNPELLYHIFHDTSISNVPASAYPLTLRLSVPNAPLIYFRYPVNGTASNAPALYFTPGENPTYVHEWPITWAWGIDFYIGVMPDRNTTDEHYILSVSVDDQFGNTLDEYRIPIHVIDQDRNDNPSNFNINLNYTGLHRNYFGGVHHENDSSGMFAPGSVFRDITRQVADDWAYFFDGIGLDLIPHYTMDIYTTNRTNVDETALLGETISGASLYGHLIQSRNNVSTGAPAGGFIEMNIGGDGQAALNTTGWATDMTETNWWKWHSYLVDPNDPNCKQGDNPALCQYFLKADYYTVTQHEMLHALGQVDTTHPDLNWALHDPDGDDCLTIPGLIAYTGLACQPSTHSHFNRAGGLHLKSHFNGRELIKKFDLLVLEGMGWKLRDTSAFEPFALHSQISNFQITSDDGSFSVQPAQHKGGVFPYFWEITQGAVGINIDSFTGELSGSLPPNSTVTVVVQLKDYATRKNSHTPLTHSIIITR